MTWWNWLPQEPGASTCGRLGADGWAEYGCDSNYRFVCERGKWYLCLDILVKQAFTQDV